MYHARIVALLLIFPLLISLSACGKSPEKARKELAQMNIEYTKGKFLQYAQKGDVVVVKFFLDAGMDPNVKDDETGLTALHVSAGKGYVTTVQALLSAGAVVNVKSNDGVTPLMGAALEGHIEVVKALLTKGADVNEKMTIDDAIYRERGGVTALKLALMRGHTDIAQILIENGADVNARDGYGETPLMDAAEKGYIEIVKVLIAKGADVNAKTNGGITVLTAAENHTEIVKLLKDAGAKE